MFADELKSFYNDWLPKDVTAFQMLERTKLPYVPFFSFGEKLPVLSEGTTDPESLGFAYQAAATLIGTDFREAQALLLSSSPAIYALPDAPLPPSEWMQRIDAAIALAGFSGRPSFALSALPSRGLDLHQIVDSHQNSLVQMIEQPPTLRLAGFDISAGSDAKLASRGRVRRVLTREHKLLELMLPVSLDLADRPVKAKYRKLFCSLDLDWQMRCGPGVPSLLGHVPLPLPFHGLATSRSCGLLPDRRRSTRKVVAILRFGRYRLPERPVSILTSPHSSRASPPGQPGYSL